MNFIENFIASKSSENVRYEAGELIRETAEVRKELLTKEFPSHPQLRSQLDFLFQFVTAHFGTSTPEEKRDAFAEAVLAIKYGRDPVDFVPDVLPGIGRSDDSAIVSAVLTRNQTIYQAFAVEKGLDWALIQPAA